MASTNNTERVALWDNLRFLLILLVVVGHFASSFESTGFGKGLMLFIYTFHMPLFFFISGLFHKNDRILNKVILFVTLGFFQRIVFFLGNRLTMPQPEYSVLSHAGVYWFLFALAVFIPLTWLLRNQNLKFILLAWIVFSCFAGYDQQLGDFLLLMRLIVFYPFYLAGSMVGAGTMLRLHRDNRRKLRPAALLVFAVLAIICFAGAHKYFHFFNLFTGRNPYYAEIVSYGALARLVNYLFSAIAGISLIMLVPERDMGLVTKMGRQTLNVFFWHYPLYVLLDKVLHFEALCAGGIGGIILVLLVAVALTIFLSLDRVLYWPIRKIRDAVG